MSKKWFRIRDNYLLAYSGDIALLILAISVATWLFQCVHRHEIGHEHMIGYREAKQGNPEG